MFRPLSPQSIIRGLTTAALLLGSASPVPVRAEATAQETMNALIEQGLREIYNLDYANARKSFNALQTQFPQHPIGLYGLTTTLWWELTNDYDENNPTLEREFLASADRSIDQSRRILKEKGPDTDAARLCLGGALGLKARWSAIQGHWLAAYREGKQAFDVQQAAIEHDPTLYDAYLGVGIFHYYVAVLPAAVKVMARMIFGGSKEQGLREINIARHQGQFSRTAALLFLVNIYVNNEKDPATALTLLREGRREFPESPFFHFTELLLLDEARDWAALRAEAEDFLARVHRHDAHYDERREHMGLFALANSYQIEGNLPRALALYDDILARFSKEDRWITLCYLRRGMTQDLLGHRDQALADYRTVMKRRDVWGLHDKAKALIRRPHQPPEPRRP